MRLKNNFIFLFICVSLFLIPFLFWGNNFSFGGDDSKLYYIFPLEYLKNFTTQIISANSLGSIGFYFPQSYISSFAFLIFILSKIFFFLETHLLMMGLNLSLSFIFFYLLLSFWINNYFIKMVSGLFYVFSSFTIYTLWQNQLFSMYLIFLLPLFLFLMLYALKKDNLAFIIILSILISLFGAVLFSLPWLLGSIIVLMPLFLYMFFRYRSRFIKFCSVFIFLLFLLNFFWIFHFLYSPYSSDSYIKDDVASSITSENFRFQNEKNIKEVSSGNNLIHPFFSLFHKEIQKDYNWKTYPIYFDWNLKFYYLNLIFPIIIFFGLFFLFRKSVDLEIKKIYITALFAWVIALFLFVVRIGDWGINIFLWLNNNIPGFVMFRNMFDKFGIAMSFAYGFVLAISLKIVFDNLKNIYLKGSIIFFLTLLILFNAKPFIFGEFYKSQMWTTENTYNTISDFNEDFYELVFYLEEINTSSRFLWIPMNNANYIQIRDKYLEDNYYSGVSPLQFLANKQDFNGKLSFPAESSNKLFKSLQNKEYEDVVELLRRFNVEYIIVNNDISKDLQQSYLYSDGVFDVQGEEFKSILLGDSIAKFGERYEIYKINDRFRNEKIYLTDGANLFPNNFSDLSFEKKATYEYKVSIKNLSNKKNIVFLDPYHKQWEWYFAKDGKELLVGDHEVVFDYANGWEIDPNFIKKHYNPFYYKENVDGSIDLDLILYFKPQNYVIPTRIISALALLFCVVYLVWYAGRQWTVQRRKKDVL